MSRFTTIASIGLLIIFASALGCWSCNQLEEGIVAILMNSTKDLVSPLVNSTPEPTPTPFPFEKYSIPNLKEREYQSSQVLLTELKEENDIYSGYYFSFKTMGKNMTGWANIPDQCQDHNCPVVILIRGYASTDQYSSGFGTKNAASIFANNGYITLAPDFFGFGNSDPEPEDTWEARFIKPINVIELIMSLQDYPKIESLTVNPTGESDTQLSQFDQKEVVALTQPEQIHIWAHSNGGQITLSVLEIISQPIPASLWAPVTAPFPYSILFFTRTNEDEGKEARAWLALFERDYDVFEFNVTQHLAFLTGPIQIHHGSKDAEALQTWSDSFVDQVHLENERREKDEAKLKPIEINYFLYPDADHNLQPGNNWSQAIQRDLNFFQKNQQI